MIKAIFMGTPSSVVPTLRRIRDMPDVDVIAAVTTPDRPRGRGRKPEPPPVKQEALRLGVPVLQPQGLRGEAVQAELAALNPDVIVVAAYGRLLPPPVLELAPHGCLNLHPSLLPRHRGPSPVATAILEGDAATGVSLMLLDEGMDTGPVIARADVRLEGDETAGVLTAALFELGGALLANSLGPWVNGQLKTQPQDVSLATVTRKLERADGLADWSLPAETLARQCRAYDPWPGLYTEWEDKTLKLLEVAPLPDYRTGTAKPGQVVAVGPGMGIYAVSGEGMLSLNRVQLEGRRPVTGEEFLRGYPDILGARLGGSQQIM